VNHVMDINLAIAGRARAGMALTAAEIDELATADVLSLGMLADDVRRSRVGDRVTFVRVHAWKPGEAVPQAAREVRLDELPETLEAATAQIRAARAAAGKRRVTGFSLASLIDRARSGWGPALEILGQLKAAGLDAIVHAPVDALPDASTALGASRDAGLAIGCLSVQRPIDDRRTDLLIQMRSLAAEFSEIKTVAPLSREQSMLVPTTGYDDVRMVALARLVIATVPHVQVDWTQYGPKLAQVALTFGADDLDRVSAVDDESMGRRRMAAEDVKRNIAAAGLVAVERDLPA
jgi:2-iminoacetate synthase ThiH